MRSRGYEHEIITETINEIFFVFGQGFSYNLTPEDIADEIVNGFRNRGFRLTTDKELSFDD